MPAQSAAAEWPGGAAPEAAVRVEHGQQREGNPGARRGGDDTVGKFAWIGVGVAIGIMVNIVELGDGRITRDGHFRIGLRGDRLERVGIETRHEVVHGRSPGPEAVIAGAAPGTPRQGALERM